MRGWRRWTAKDNPGNAREKCRQASSIDETLLPDMKITFPGFFNRSRSVSSLITASAVDHGRKPRSFLSGPDRRGSQIAREILEFPRDQHRYYGARSSG